MSKINYINPLMLFLIFIPAFGALTIFTLNRLRSLTFTILRSKLIYLIFSFLKWLAVAVLSYQSYHLSHSFFYATMCLAFYLIISFCIGVYFGLPKELRAELDEKMGRPQMGWPMSYIADRIVKRMAVILALFLGSLIYLGLTCSLLYIDKQYIHHISPINLARFNIVFGAILLFIVVYVFADDGPRLFKASSWEDFKKGRVLRRGVSLPILFLILIVNGLPRYLAEAHFEWQFIKIFLSVPLSIFYWKLNVWTWLTGIAIIIGFVFEVAYSAGKKFKTKSAPFFLILKTMFLLYYIIFIIVWIINVYHHRTLIWIGIKELLYFIFISN